MKIFIKETNKEEVLSLIDHHTGTDCITDFVGNTGALSDGQFVYDEDLDSYVCDQETFDWWNSVVAAHQAVECRLSELIAEHGSEAVSKVVQEVGGWDLEDLAPAIDNALDEAFGVS